ncbi:MAG: hypothetical protein WD425_00085 [Nitrospirales bacterium]
MGSMDRDIELKLRLRRILFCQGYWSPIEVELSHFEPQAKGVKRLPLTDLDVLGIRFDQLFVRHRIVGDCKSGKTVSDIGRVFWLKGVKDYFGADLGYYIRPQIDIHARTIAPKLGLRTLNESELGVLEKTIGVDSLQIPFADLSTYKSIEEMWGIGVAKGDKPSKEQLKLKKVYSYLSYRYWSTEFHRNLLQIVELFQDIADSLRPLDPKHILLAYIGSERFAHCLLEIATYVEGLGAADIRKYVRLYLYGGGLGLKEKEKFFELLQLVTGSNEPLDPPYFEELLELIGRLIRNRDGACDVLRHITAAYIHCAFLGNSAFPSIGIGGTNTSAIVLAKDICFTFAKLTGISRSLFSAMDPL